VSVPEIVATVTADESPIDAAYVVIEHVDGRHLTDVRKLSPGAHERLVREAGTHLGAVHDLDYEGRYGRLVVDDGAFGIDYPFDEWGAIYRSVVEWNVERVDDRFDDLRGPVGAALDAFETFDDERAVDQSILYRDSHAENLVFAPDDSADRLRDELRGACVDARGGCREDHFDETYPAYRLLSVLDHLHYFDYFSRFVSGGDPDDAADWLRGFVHTRVEELS